MRRLEAVSILPAVLLTCMLACVGLFPSQLEEHPDDAGQNMQQDGGGASGGNESGGGSDAAGGVASAGGYLSATYAYAVDGDSIYVQTGRNYCYDDCLVEDVEVAVAYDLSGFTLTLTGLSATGPLQEDLLLEGGDVVRLEKDTQTEGLKGRWTLTAVGKEPGDMYAPAAWLGTQAVELFDSTLEIRVDKPKAEIEFGILAALVELDPNISLQLVSNSEVHLEGRRTGEAVTVVFDDWDSTTYTSSFAGHAAHVFRADPKECPNEPAPDWFYDFLRDNSGLF